LLDRIAEHPVNRGDGLLLWVVASRTKSAIAEQCLAALCSPVPLAQQQPRPNPI
jgi:hypothetical protein